MPLSYFVLLKPSEIRFTTNIVGRMFDNGLPLTETLAQLVNGEILLEDIPKIEVVWYQEKWEWYTLNNRRLWVFKELEKTGKCKLIKTRRKERIENIIDYPAMLYGSASLAKISRNASPANPRRSPAPYNSPSRRSKSTSRSPSKERWSKFKRERVVAYEERNIAVEYRVERGVDVNMEISHRPRTNSSSSDNNNRQLSLYNPDKPSDKILHYRQESHVSKFPKKSFRSNVRFHPYRTPRLLKLESNIIGREIQPYSKPHSYVCGVISFRFWQKKRTEFFRSIYSISNGRVRDPARYARSLYTCGVCFKSFKSRVSLEQHSEELLHWACVRCGKFFTSPTALGQHKLALGHSVF
ncbi:predicted protein [Nematostella vectensis]|uniref:C2H2-type domain-containing protein n=1 Tax=Nematostella vectensis TaxID=45351 RepID=A7RP10_NEMVE|nr:uncharacterized protein LOC5518963 [Nematostella vectensis]EDO46833.1 predicted protein [Nematostella vectensis]|eukprot:XP_001638896.1 predicted protein [Nematostella vectensis]